MRVVFCGSRRWIDKEQIKLALKALKKKYGDDLTIITGGAVGADSFAEWMAEGLGMNVMVFKARWEIHGSAAGPIRNRQMGW